MKNIFAALLLAALPLACANPPRADLPDIDAAIEASDLSALEALSKSGRGEGMLAAGILAALRGQDEAALTRLAEASADPVLSPALRRTGWSAASGVYLRQGRFGDAAAAMEAAEFAAPAPDEETARSAAQSLAFARTASGAAPMTAEVAPAGEAAITRDLANLPRANALINGALQEAVLDTGANYSTITQSVADRLGLRALEGGISVDGSAADGVGGGLAVADTLELAGGLYRNVLFIVLPDDALSFADGAYEIPAIIGLPVFAAMGRVAFEDTGHGEFLRHTASAEGWSKTSNLLFSGLNPIALVTANGLPVRMFIDSGAGESHLSPRAGLDHPSLLQGAVSGEARFGGAGGSRVLEDAAILARLEIGVGAETVTLENIQVLEDEGDGRHGLIGQDVLKAGRGYVIDFGAMRFELIPDTPKP